MPIKLGPLVGATTHDEAKIWVQTYKPATLECKIYTDQEASNQVPNSPFLFRTVEKDGCTGLVTVSLPQDNMKYYYSVAEHKVSGSVPIPRIHSFRSFPASNKEIESFSFGFVSCNKPEDLKMGKEPHLRNMWRCLFAEMSSHDAAFLLAAGDQVYADHEKSSAWQQSLDKTSGKSPLELYRDVYEKHWSFREMHSVLNNFPCFMIWDDHEITNGWGSNKSHTEKDAQDVFQVASKVYEEFQHSHNPPTLAHPPDHTLTPGHKPYYYAFRYGPAAFLVLDLRGNRRREQKSSNGTKEGQLLGPDQWAALEHWFASKEAKDSKVLFLISSVPMLHLKWKLARLTSWIKTDIADQWSTPHNKDERRRLLTMLFDKYMEHGRRQVVILGGDVHVGTIAKIKDTKKTQQTIHQFTSSPISNRPAAGMDTILAKFGNAFKFHLDDKKERPVEGKIYKRFHQRNFGIVTVKLGSPPRITIKMYEEYKGEFEETLI